ncbi:MAG: glycine--tRNA ligase subunit beta [Pseudomonadota bacterium]|nr:glycine--tRNA ligase subunit beta [Pseudomonadota bacterium]
MSELFIEIGTEELPAHAVGPALEALSAGLVRLLGPITYGKIRTFGTPRRLAVSIEDVAAARPAVSRVVTGPPVAQAFPNGEPGPVAEAFAKARGVALEQLLQVDGPKGKVIAVRRVEGGEPTAEIVGKGLEDVVLGIPFKRSMRWTTDGARFLRPIHSLCALYAGEVIESSVAGVLTGGHSHGHWLYAPEAFPVTGPSTGTADAWLEELRQRYVLADIGIRRGLLVRQLETLAAEQGADATFDPDLVDEVVQLVEWPRAIVGRFSETLLELPPRLLVESMKKNQRYFPLYRDGVLTNEFLVVTNNPFGDDLLIAEGNARVLAARFHDAKFFYAEDRKKRLVEHGERLAGMMWIRGLGTMAERQARLAEAAAGLAQLIGADPDIARAAGALSKCDLTTQMVGEFPELQGHVGRLLAVLDGASNQVGLAIEEHYLPRFAGDILPTSGAGRALALAERLTLVARGFSAGLAPKGNADGLGLRRATIGLVALVLDLGWRGPLGELFAAAGEAGGDDLYEFVIARLRASLADDAPVDIVDAVLAARPRDHVGPVSMDLTWAARRVHALAALVKAGEFSPIRTAFRRAAGLVKEHTSTDYDTALLGGEPGVALHDALQGMPHTGDVGSALEALAALRPVLDRYFADVMVMCDDPVARASRLGLLRSIVERFSGLADFTRLSGE